MARLFSGHGESALPLGNEGWRIRSTTPDNVAREFSSIGRRSLCMQVSRLLLLLCYLVISSGCVTQPTSNRNVPVSGAQLSLDEAPRSQADPSAAAGHYLDAAYTASGLMNGTKSNQAADARLTYNNACQELAILLGRIASYAFAPRPFDRAITPTNCICERFASGRHLGPELLQLRGELKKRNFMHAKH